jgi:hypothetical protein
MFVKELRIASLLLAAMASVVCAQVVTAPIVATPVAAPQPADWYGTSNPPFTPAQIQQAYGFSSLSATGSGQTIAIIDAYNYPNAASALNTFSSQFGLPQVNAAGGPTFTVLNQSGGTALPGTDPAGAGNDNWEFEEALDFEWVHAMAPNANIILYEANNDSNANLFAAVNTARNQSGVSVVSMSWGCSEYSEENVSDSSFTTPSSKLALKQGVTFVASTGDSGAPGEYPAFSPNVVAAGGTSLYLTTSLSYSSESAWSGSGGGVSQYEPKPAYQQTSSHGSVLANATGRAIPDVSFDADPYTGVYTYDPYNGGWFQIGGTSLSAPCWAGLIADADQLRVAAGNGTLDGPSQTLPALYSLPSTDFHDITTGNNGYAAGPGYDLATGLGTPVANKLVPDLAAYGVTSPATISLGSVVNARVMSGVAGTVGATVSNSAASGSNNLNYTLAAVVSSGSATLGTVTPGSDSLAPARGDANTVSATSTNLGLNTITFTATDFNASNTPQTIDATLTVVANRVVTATPVSFGILHAGQTPAGSYSTTLSTTGDNNHYTAVTVPGGSDGLVTVQGTSTVFNTDNQSEVRTVTAGACNTPGLISNTISLATVGEGLAGENPIPVQVSYTTTVFSGSASWTGASGSSWGMNGSWQDTQTAGVQVAPGQFAGYNDSAVLDDTAVGSRAITLDGASPTLSSLVFNTPSGNGYSIGPGTGGTLQMNNGGAAAAITVIAGSHSISAPISFAGSGAITLNPSTQLTVSSNISGSVTIANSGTFELAGGTAASVAQITGGGALQLDAGSQLSLTGLNGVLGYQGTSVTSVPSNFSVLSSLAIAGTTNAWTGDLNIGYGGFVLTNATTAEVAQISNMIAEGADKGKWDGAEGITSSDARANPSTVGIASMYISSGPYAGDLIVAAELAGDANMDGTVNSKDLAIVNSNWLGSPSNGVTNWQVGDFNYDGTVNSKDFALVNGNWLSSSMPLVAGAEGLSAMAAAGSSLSGGGAEAVPEPGTLALLAAGLAVLGVAAVRRRASRAG